MPDINLPNESGRIDPRIKRQQEAQERTRGFFLMPGSTSATGKGDDIDAARRNNQAVREALAAALSRRKKK